MRAFLPTIDIFENEDALTVVLEMPGVDRENIEVRVEKGLLTVKGKIDFNKYEKRSLRGCPPKPTSGEVSGDGTCNSRTDTVVAHRPPPRNRPAAVVAHNKQAAVAERHTPLAV
jgi:hypothetical protein